MYIRQVIIGSSAEYRRMRDMAQESRPIDKDELSSIVANSKGVIGRINDVFSNLRNVLIIGAIMYAAQYVRENGHELIFWYLALLIFALLVLNAVQYVVIWADSASVANRVKNVWLRRLVYISLTLIGATYGMSMYWIIVPNK